MITDRRAANLERLKTEQWDVLIVGGGINGAGIARDLALRGSGLKIALVEKNHFASGTSGKNSQLIHGGLRYLKYFDIGLVKEALRERALLLKLAPALVRPLEFLIPCYSTFDRWFYQIGLTAYDALAGGRSLGRHHALDASSARKLEPHMAHEGLRAGLLFFDAAVHSARLVIENIVDADRLGACVVNYVKAEGNAPELQAEDALSGCRFAVRAKKVVDATGAWSEGAPLRLVRGSHLIFPKIQSGDEAIAYFDERGRIVFLIPWGESGDLTLVGTTDVDHSDGADAVQISADEIAYLKSIVHRLFPGFRREPVTSYSSLRPLIAETGRSATSTSREHRIWESADGVVHVSGGKYTTYRLMSEETVDLLLDRMLPGRDLPCRTPETPFHIPEVSGDPLVRTTVAVEREFARRLSDLLYVSTYWGHERRVERGWVLPLARQMGALLGWDEARVEEEVNLACSFAPPRSADRM